MQTILDFFSSIDPILAAFIATCFTWVVTAAGSSLVFFFGNASRKWLDGMLGFTGGVMVAASFWSLLSPSIEMSERRQTGVKADKGSSTNNHAIRRWLRANSKLTM